MDIQILRKRIQRLDPELHASLISTLTRQFEVGKVKQSRENTVREQCMDPFLEAFERTVEEINRCYIPGTTAYIEKRHSDLFHKIDKTEDRLNEIWGSGCLNKTTLREFRAVLQEWYLLNVKAVEIYKVESGNNS
jgi:hypothetical protein